MGWTKTLEEVYGLRRGDLHFLSIDDDGDLVLTLDGVSSKLLDLVDGKGSVTLRIPQLITSQITKSLDAFHRVAETYGFSGRFKPLYPIKVNQRKLEVKTVVDSSPVYGLESGTKSEFVICKKMFREQKGRIIMSNGVKDRSYFELMRDAVLEGHRVLISIEGLQELKFALEIMPRDKLELFLRIKPYAEIHGKWGASSGRDSKFGLSIHEISKVLDLLRNSGAQDTLIGIHAHPGSQVTNYSELSTYARFMSTIFQEIKLKGFMALRNIDFGGGLPVDYTGWMEDNIFEGYYEALFRGMNEVFEGDFPNVLTESGRAITALSSLVLVEVLDVYTVLSSESNSENHIARNSSRENKENSNKKDSGKEESDQPAHYEVGDLTSKDSDLDALKIIEMWRNLPQNEDLSMEGIRRSELLKERQKQELRKLFFRSKFHPFLDRSGDLITPDYMVLGNFSVFNAACDRVLVNQYFPILPTRGMNKRPKTFARLIDITCDSDGEISNFVPRDIGKELYTEDGYPLTDTLPYELPGFPIPDPWGQSHIAIPLLGAYQDIIEFDHNLIGDLPDVLVHSENGKIRAVEISEAQDISSLLKTVGYYVDISDYPYILDE